MDGFWQLAKLTLTTDVRRPGSHIVRLGLVFVLYMAVCYFQFLSMRSARGLPLFQSQLLITAFFLSATAVFGFSQTITEEKEEETLGLMRLAEISPLAIILGKTAGLIAEALFLIVIQIPFTVVAITLGGVSWAQVFSAYVALGAYLWLLATVGVLASVLQPTGGKAARWTAIVVLAYFLPLVLVRFSSWGGIARLTVLSPVSLPLRFLEITESGFHESPWCSAVAFGLIAGFACLIVAWLVFDRCALGEVIEGERKKPIVHRSRIRRAWSRPILWREYVFVNGGLAWTLIRIAVQFAILFSVYSIFRLYIFGAETLGFAFAWSAIWSGVFAILDGSWSASRLFRDEIRHRTWSSLVQTPYQLPHLALEKTLGWALGLAPTIVSPFLFTIAMVIAHEHMPRHFMMYLELFIGTATIALSVLGYLHLLVLLSLHFGWKATPMALTVCFACGWMFVAATFQSQLSDVGRCSLFAITSAVIVGLMVVFQLQILNRLRFLAATT